MTKTPPIGRKKKRIRVKGKGKRGFLYILDIQNVTF